MLNRTQWVNTPFRASGSSRINANDCAFGGKSSQVKDGEMFSPSHVYFAGIASPVLKAELLTVKAISTSTVFNYQGYPVDLNWLFESKGVICPPRLGLAY